MKYFFQTFLATLISALTLIIYQVTIMPEENDVAWIQGLFDIKERLLVETEGEPRVIVMGGSDAHFSLSAEQIENETGVKTVNFGTHAALGTDLQLHILRDYIRVDDIVVYSGNYYSMTVDEPNATKVSFVLKNRPAYIFAQPVSDWPLYLGGNVLDKTLRSMANTVNRVGARKNAASTNRYGDETSNIVQPGVQYPISLNGQATRVPATDSAPPGIIDLAFFDRELDRKGASLLIYWMALMEREAYNVPWERQKMERFQQFADAWDIDTLNRPFETLFAPEEIYNGELHANSIGRERYTGILIERLKPYL